MATMTAKALQITFLFLALLTVLAWTPCDNGLGGALGRAMIQRGVA